MLPWPIISCPECGAGFGETHWPACRCAATERPAAPAPGGYSDGQAAPIRACRRRGWAVVHVPGEGFRPCSPDEPGSSVDLDRYDFWLAHGEDALHGGEPDLDRRDATDDDL